MYRIPLVKNTVFLENQHAHGETYIPIIGFPDLNYGIKVINYNKLLSLIVNSLSATLCVTQRPFMFTFVGPNAELCIPNQRQFSVDFKNKFHINIWGQIPLSK